MAWILLGTYSTVKPPNRDLVLFTTPLNLWVGREAVWPQIQAASTHKLRVVANKTGGHDQED